MERVDIDTEGPNPPDEDGNIYILVIICCFTRWVSLYPIKSTSAEDCVDALLQHVGTFGTPSQILSDKGTQFINKLVSELIKIMGPQHITTLPYSKEENAIVERVNKEILRHLKGLIFEHNEVRKWSKHYIPLVQRILNTSRVESINAVPAELLFGNAINLDRGVLLPPSLITDHRKSLSAWADEMLTKQQELLTKARNEQRRRDETHIAKADPRRTTYEVGEYVLVEYQPSSMVKGRPPNKFLPNLRGPLRVKSKQGDRYTLYNLISGNDEETHIKRIHPYHMDSRQLSPQEVAKRDILSLFDVEEILSHSGNTEMKNSDWDFLCKFLGWDESYNLWLPYREVSSNPAMHKYAITNRMRFLIPQRFKHLYR